jgi:5-methylcytosine-specific restriction endonuclease McrA
MPKRICSVAGCCAQHRARGLCSNHYNQQHQPDRHRKSTVACGHCGTPTLKHTANRYAERFCSLACRDARRALDTAKRRLPVLFVGQVIRRASPRRTSQLTVIPGQRWTSGPCVECRTQFTVNQPGARYCSRLCLKRAGRRAWKERTDRLVPAATRAYVYERDRWICQLCMKPIRRDVEAPHPLSHSVDHVVPQSQDGQHGAGNLRAAHLICNALRGDRGGNEQLALL